MMSSSSTVIGRVIAVTGGAIQIHLSNSVSSGLAIIKGTTYRVGQVGSFVRIPQGYKDLYGIVCEVGADAVPDKLLAETSGSWVRAQLIGESVGLFFERGISQYPHVGDEVHLVTSGDLSKIYGAELDDSHVEIGRLSSAENVTVKINLNPLVTRHSAVLGSTGSGKSTTVAGLIRAMTVGSAATPSFPSARILLLDIHGEYSNPLRDVAKVFRIDPNKGQEKLSIPFWALDADSIINFLAGSVKEPHLSLLLDKITELKASTLENYDYPDLDINSLTVDTPVPFSLKQMWHDLMHAEVVTYADLGRTKPTSCDDGSAEDLIAPKYEAHAPGNQGPFLPTVVPGIKKQLSQIRSRLLDRQYDFLLHPAEWEPSLSGKVEKDLPHLLKSWLGHEKPVTILDLSGVPSTVLVNLVGSILNIIYNTLFWARHSSEGGKDRPLLIVMEEAHRYLSGEKNSANAMVQQIVKEGRKYGIGAMVVSQRPSEIDETILSQCGTFVAMRLSNPADRSRVKGTLPDSLAGLMDMLPILRTGEAIITGEAATLPIRCRIMLPEKEFRPESEDPSVVKQWVHPRRDEKYMAEIYQQMATAWRSKSPIKKKFDSVPRHPVDDEG